MSLRALLIATREAHISGFPGQVPTATVEVLGAPLLTRIAEQMNRAGIHDIVVVTDIDSAQVARVQNVEFVYAKTSDLWRTAERAFEELEMIGVRGVVIARADHYAEIEWQAVLAHHLHFRNRATRVWCEEYACDIFLVSPGRRNEAAQLMRNRLSDSRTIGVRYKVGAKEYINLLHDCSELRKLSKDALYGVNQIVPHGTEVRPGVWLGERARISREARVVAPAYIGGHARVHPGALVTRDSILEHHTFVDCGSALEDAWVQPFSKIGAGIDVAHAVVAGGHMYHLAKNVAFETQDPKLLTERKENAAVRTVQAAAALLSYVPALMAKSSRQQALSKACSSRNFEVQAGEKDRQGERVAKLAPGLAILRRYGNE